MRSRVPQAMLQRLAGVPLFSECSRDELRSIAGLGTDVGVKEGYVLCAEGRPGSEFFLIADGTARCVVGRKEVARLGPGDYFGELALLLNRPRSATVTATSDMTVHVFDRREFAALLDDSPRIARKLLVALAKREEPGYRG